MGGCFEGVKVLAILFVSNLSVAYAQFRHFATQDFERRRFYKADQLLSATLNLQQPLHCNLLAKGCLLLFF